MSEMMALHHLVKMHVVTTRDWTLQVQSGGQLQPVEVSFRLKNV